MDSDMALTVLIKQEGEDDLCLTLDAPRIVIGRGKGCEVQLPDPTVSMRHAVIRMRGGGNLVEDEGSTNGLVVGSVRLPAHTPRAVADGELIRIGRVWLELRFGGGMSNTAHQSQKVALAYLRRQLVSQGEPADAFIEVVEGPDRGCRLALTDDGSDHVIGRSRDNDLRLNDEQTSRRHVAVCHDGDCWRVRDLGSRCGSELDGGVLDERGARWSSGGRLTVGDSVIELRDPVPEALRELQAGADLKMRPAEREMPPPGQTEPARLVEAPADPVVEVPEPEMDASVEEIPSSRAAAEARVDTQRLGAGYATLDAFVALVAISLMGMSIAGLMYVLG